MLKRPPAPLRRWPVLAPRMPATAVDLPAAVPAPASDGVRLQGSSDVHRTGFRWLPTRLLPLHLGLALLVLVLATGSVLAWQATRFHQRITTGKYVTSLGIGLGVDPVTQAVQGASDTFRVGTTVVLVVTIVGWNGYAKARLLLGTTLETTQQWQVSDVFSAPPAPQSHFTASVQLAQEGRYRWEIDLTGFDSGCIVFFHRQQPR